MERLESTSHLRQLLFNDVDLLQLIQYKGFSYVLTNMKERFSNINDFDENIIIKELELRISSINRLLDKEGKFSDGWKIHIGRNIYWKLFAEEMDSEDKKYARRAGLGSSILHFDGVERVKVSEIMVNLEKRILNNELKNIEQANQFVDALIYEEFKK
jgi:hypothetical protein